MTFIEPSVAQKDVKPTPNTTFVKGQVDVMDDTVALQQVHFIPDNTLSEIDKPKVTDISVRQLNANKITAGILQSSDGLTYFDLDVGKRIVINDGVANRLLLGKDDAGVVKMKLSQPTYDVLTTTDDKLVWSSDFNMFKIVSTVTGSHTVTAGEVVALGATFSFAHNLGYKPTVVGSFINNFDNVSRMMPYTRVTQTYADYAAFPVTSAIDWSCYILSIDNTNINVQLTINGLLGLSYFAAGQIVDFKFYCIRETTV